MLHSDPVVIVSAVRTPLGRSPGDFSSLPAWTLGGRAIEAAIVRSGLGPERVDEVLMGCALPAGQGQAPARQAARAGGLPDIVGATAINKAGGSGLKAILLANDMILAGAADVIVAGGMESMSNAPYLLAKPRGGFRIGSGHIFDNMQMDGLDDAYEKGRSIGKFGEATAEAYGFGREDQDAYALETMTRAGRAVADGTFAAEIVPVEVSTLGGQRLIDRDEAPGWLSPEQIPLLPPAFGETGTITEASAAINADGAAALVLTRRSLALREGLPILGRIRTSSAHAQDPAWFTTAPIPAFRKLLTKAGWSVADVDLFEIHETFAVVPMIVARDLRIPREKINIHGGACALGHPLGASGARLVVTLLYALARFGFEKGAAGLCIGGGEALAIAIEREA